MEKIFVVAIVGPTASGKTKLSVEMAKRFNGEIVSADSIQIYKQMNIASAKPTIDEMQSIPHHLVDCIDIKDTFSVADYCEKAKECILNINARNKLPILSGGTGLYVDSLLNNIKFNEDEIDLSLRSELENIAKEKGVQVLIDELSEADIETAKSLHPNNLKRIIRAVEICRTTGLTMEEYRKKSKCEETPYRSCIIGLDYRDREKLYDRINKRVDNMISLGLVEEARKIYNSNYSKTAMNAIGYKEIIPYIKGEEDLLVCIEKLKRETRRYAKRQLTWFRRNKDINWIYIDDFDDYEEILKKAEKTIEKFYTM